MISCKFFKAAQKWQKIGRRSIKAEISSTSESYNDKMWVYDYDFMYGKYIQSEEELPTAEDMENQRKAELENKIRELKALVEQED